MCRVGPKCTILAPKHACHPRRYVNVRVYQLIILTRDSKDSEYVLVIGMLGVQLHINHESLPEKRKICPSAKHEDQI